MRRPSLALTITVIALAGLRLSAVPAPPPMSDEEALLHRAALVFTRAVSTPASAIPAAVLMTATGIAVVPSAVRDGTRYYGAGVLSARGGRPDVWTPPGIVAFEGNIPVDLETDTVDFVIVVTTRRGLNDLVQPRFAAARPISGGPLGVTASRIDADLLAYMHFDGYFAGVTIGDCIIHEMQESNAALYGRPYSSDDIIRGAGFFHVTPAGRTWRRALADYFRELS